MPPEIVASFEPTAASRPEVSVRLLPAWARVVALLLPTIRMALALVAAPRVIVPGSVSL